MPEKPRARVTIPLLALFVANLALACGPWLVRLAGTEAHVGPVASAFWRLAIALPILVVAARSSNEAAPPRRGLLFALVALGGVLFAADLAAWHIGILHTRLANATLLGNVTAILFPAYGFIVARRWPTRRQGMALLSAGAGAFLLVGRSYEVSARNLSGDLLCIGAGFCYTGYLVAVDRVRPLIGPLTTLSGAAAAGAPVLLATALLLGEPIRPDSWTPLVLLAFGSQLIGQGFILYAIGRLQPLLIGLMMLIQPIVAAVIGWTVFGERLTGVDLVGAAAIAAAILLVRESAPRLQADQMSLRA